ncbi:MAG TPA: DUF4332 domain-containing protein [archaeon]|nr:DUF4332 domain-containing protein [archaeon]
MASAPGTANQEKSRSPRLPWYGWVALSTLVMGELGLFLGVFAIQTLFYCIAWWSYIVLADAWVLRRRGHSLLCNRPWEFLILAFWSVAIWNLFELFNFRLRNWFYVNVPTEFLFGAILTFLAYATVIPGLFETYDVLRVYGVAEGVHMRPWRIRPAALALSVGTGFAMLISVLIWPRYAFPWVWCFVVFLGDPLCYRTERTRANSLLGQLERGDPRPFIRLLLSGLICGGLWEFWNFWAYTKWIYTVPFFEDLKWFEMPPLGFLGFPPFTLQCYVLINLLNGFRRSRGWEEAGHVGPGAPIWLSATAVAFACLFNVAVYSGIDRLTVQSYSPTLEEMDGVPGSIVERLATVGIVSPQALLQRTGTRERVTALSRQTGISEDALLALQAAARLVNLKGLGAPHYNELSRLGITRLEQLARQDPEVLAVRWRDVAGQKLPTLAQTKVWVRAARAQQNNP